MLCIEVTKHPRYRKSKRTYFHKVMATVWTYDRRTEEWHYRCASVANTERAAIAALRYQWWLTKGVK